MVIRWRRPGGKAWLFALQLVCRLLHLGIHIYIYTLSTPPPREHERSPTRRPGSPSRGTLVESSRAPLSTTSGALCPSLSTSWVEAPKMPIYLPPQAVRNNSTAMQSIQNQIQYRMLQIAHYGQPTIEIELDESQHEASRAITSYSTMDTMYVM